MKDVGEELFVGMVKEYAEELGLHPSTIRNHIKGEKILVEKTGRGRGVYIFRPNPSHNPNHKPKSKPKFRYPDSSIWDYDGEIREYIDDRSLKMNWIANQLGMITTTLYSKLRADRPFTKDEVTEINQLLGTSFRLSKRE